MEIEQGAFEQIRSKSTIMSHGERDTCHINTEKKQNFEALFKSLR